MRIIWSRPAAADLFEIANYYDRIDPALAIDMIDRVENAPAPLIDNPRVALVAYFFAITFAAMHLGPAIAVTYQLVKPRMRALASAILLFILNMIGLGLGPLLVGILSDALAPSYGHLSIRYSLMIVAASKFLAIWMFWVASKTLIGDLEAKNLWRASPVTS